MLPHYATAGAAGLDLRACIDAALVLNPGDSQLVSLRYIDLRQRPGLCRGNPAALGPRRERAASCLATWWGLIDSDYQGPLMVSLWNRGKAPFTIQPLDRIAQLVIVPVQQGGVRGGRGFRHQRARGAGGVRLYRPFKRASRPRSPGPSSRRRSLPPRFGRSKTPPEPFTATRVA